MTTAKLDATRLQLVSELAEFKFEIRYKTGKNHQDADGLSRMPLIKNPNAEYTETSLDPSMPLEELLIVHKTYKDIHPVINLIKNKSRLSVKIMAGLSTASRRLLIEKKKLQDSSRG